MLCICNNINVSWTKWEVGQKRNCKPRQFTYFGFTSSSIPFCKLYSNKVDLLTVEVQVKKVTALQDISCRNCI